MNVQRVHVHVHVQLDRLRAYLQVLHEPLGSHYLRRIPLGRVKPTFYSLSDRVLALCARSGACGRPCESNQGKF